MSENVQILRWFMTGGIRLLKKLSSNPRYRVSVWRLGDWG